jgi:Fic family protein
LLEEANRHLGELNAFSMLIPDIDFFIKMHETKEATLSNMIEGTQTTFDKAILDKKDIELEKRGDWQKIQNYIDAMKYAIKKLKDLPLALRLIKLTHKKLLQDVRGENKFPGEIRVSQNWIGGSSIKDAHFIPPISSEIPNLMSDIEIFIHDKAIDVPSLIKVALLHYQFETIHPFLDGNGRVGRLLIVLYLTDKKILNKPLLYLSDYFIKNKNLYYSLLNSVRNNNNIEDWIKFFLVAISQTSIKSRDTLTKIIKIREICEKKILTFGKRRIIAQQLVNILFEKPIISIKNIENKLKISRQSASLLLRLFVNNKILKQEFLGKNKKNKYFIFYDYLNLFIL